MPPPQTLYRTRNSPSPIQGPAQVIPTKTSLAARASGLNQSIEAPFWGKDWPTYDQLKGKHRSDSFASDQPLLPNIPTDDFEISISPMASSKRSSDVYSHYQHSLNSLHDIIDRVSSHAFSLPLFDTHLLFRTTSNHSQNCWSTSTTSSQRHPRLYL